MPESNTAKNDKTSNTVFQYGLFGLFRYYLAVMVCISHLMPWEYMHFGMYAVFAFFTLSGYLITLSYATHYSKQESGLAKFYLNRFIRVYPAFFLVFVISLCVAYFFPEEAVSANERFTIPSSKFEWFSNFILVSLTYPNGFRAISTIVPTTWSLGIEITIWAFIPFFVLYKKFGMAWVAISLLSFLYLALPDNNSAMAFIMRYYSISVSSFCFCIGFILCFYVLKYKRLEIPQWLTRLTLVLYPLSYGLSFIFWTNSGNMENWDHMGGQVYGGLYLFMIINTLTIIILANSKRDSSKTLLNKIDEFLGDVSYPLFLCHILCGSIVLIFYSEIGQARTIPYAIITFTISNIMAVLMVVFLENNIKKIRNLIRR